ncbi:hypothetical protein H0H81_008190 [Sphagnurus paluster]|uniref:gamma-glutamylcyclotransferase n=1 Tax=Sphagnurus paluster TaxID=117069 RepID=A0A9P7K7K1_9AGAR|nr:hypothetical protein H0H81_008190 [Sphagnurus paluster]
MALSATPTLYFAYGSNLRRCPGSNYIGIALLTGWKWFINTCGYANVKWSTGDVVYGMIYTLTPEDEAKLDQFEGVPKDYIKQTLCVEFLGEREGGKMIQALVYTDVERLNEGPPKTEYITRINRAVDDARQEGIPQEYVDKYIRPFIPADILRN